MVFPKSEKTKSWLKDPWRKIGKFTGTRFDEARYQLNKDGVICQNEMN